MAIPKFIRSAITKYPLSKMKSQTATLRSTNKKLVSIKNTSKEFSLSLKQTTENANSSKTQSPCTAKELYPHQNVQKIQVSALNFSRSRVKETKDHAIHQR
jgi:hypothetical protein